MLTREMVLLWRSAVELAQCGTHHSILQHTCKDSQRRWKKKSQLPCASNILADKIISLAYICFIIDKSLDLSILGNMSLSCKIGLLSTDRLRKSYKLALEDAASMSLYRELFCLRGKCPTNSKKFQMID